MSNRSLGRRYAKALFDLAAENNAVSEVKQNVAAVQKLWSESNELRVLIGNPTVPREAVKAVFSDLLGRVKANTLLVKLIELLADRGRLTYLPDVLEAFGELAEAHAGDLRVEVTSPAALSEDYYRSLVSTIERSMKSKITLVKHQDPSLIGGVVVKIGDKIFDGSLRSRLEGMKESLLQGSQLS